MFGVHRLRDKNSLTLVFRYDQTWVFQSIQNRDQGVTDLNFELGIRFDFRAPRGSQKLQEGPKISGLPVQSTLSANVDTITFAGE